MGALEKRSRLHMRCNCKIGAVRLFYYCNAFALLIKRDSNVILTYSILKGFSCRPQSGIS